MRQKSLGSKTCKYVSISLVFVALSCPFASVAGQTPGSSPIHKTQRVPVIDITDLYHPYQDPGDNFDLITAYALPEVDLRAVILDVTEAFRRPVADHPVLYHDSNGPRDPGIIPVEQLNYMFDRNVPFATGPFSPLRSLDDKMLDVPAFQQQGVELLIRTLRESSVPVTIVSFGSLRVLAAAYNREPALLRDKVAQVHVSAGTATENFEYGSSKSHNEIPGGEWNVALDPLAFIRIMRSGLPIILYPCATKDGAFELGRNNTYWKLLDLQFVSQVNPKLQRYLSFAFGRSQRADFLRAMDVGPDDPVAATAFQKEHHVWETAIWLAVSSRRLVRRADQSYVIVPDASVSPSDTMVKMELRPCFIQVRDDGRLAITFTDKETNFRVFEREDPELTQSAFREALPELYRSFAVPTTSQSFGSVARHMSPTSAPAARNRL
jgi:hypothetical protein